MNCLAIDVSAAGASPGWKRCGDGKRDRAAFFFTPEIRIAGRSGVISWRAWTCTGRSRFACGRDQGTRHLALRCERGYPGVLRKGQVRTVGRSRCGLLPRGGGRGVRQSRKGEVRAAEGLGPVSGAESWHDRPAGTQHHLDFSPRGGPQREVRGHPVLRRAGIHGAEKNAPKTVAGLKGATVCVQKGTTSAQNLADYSAERGLGITPLIIDSSVEVVDAFVAGRCRALTSRTLRNWPRRVCK